MIKPNYNYLKEYSTPILFSIICYSVINNKTFFKTTIRDTKNYEELIENIRILDLIEVV